MLLQCLSTYMLAFTSTETQNNQIFPISMTTSFKTERFLLYSKRTHGTYDLELQKWDNFVFVANL